MTGGRQTAAWVAEREAWRDYKDAVTRDLWRHTGLGIPEASAVTRLCAATWRAAYEERRRHHPSAEEKKREARRRERERRQLVGFPAR